MLSHQCERVAGSVDGVVQKVTSCFYSFYFQVCWFGTAQSISWRSTLGEGTLFTTAPDTDGIVGTERCSCWRVPFLSSLTVKAKMEREIEKERTFGRSGGGGPGRGGGSKGGSLGERGRRGSFHWDRDQFRDRDDAHRHHHSGLSRSKQRLEIC